jgi:hypothetical protein
MKQDRKHFGCLSRFLFLDLIFNRKTRPIFVYAIIIIGMGAVLYHWLEGWGWLDSIYFVVITLTTIGYGDFHPTQPITKVITIFYGISGIVLILLIFDVIRKARGETIKQEVEERKEQMSSDKSNG